MGNELVHLSKKMDEADARARAESLKESVAGLLAVLRNDDGLARLRAVTAEEWAEAEARDGT